MFVLERENNKYLKKITLIFLDTKNKQKVKTNKQ